MLTESSIDLLTWHCPLIWGHSELSHMLIGLWPWPLTPNPGYTVVTVTADFNSGPDHRLPSCIE